MPWSRLQSGRGGLVPRLSHIATILNAKFTISPENEMYSKLFASVLALILFSPMALSNEDYKSIQMAIVTSALAEDLNSGKLSNEIRQNLLQGASSADQQNIKSMLARWKKPKKFRYEAQFNHLVIFRNSSANQSEEVFRIFPKPNSSGAFYINGREWTPPADGKVYRSLNEFFAAKGSHASMSVFDLPTFGLVQIAISRAHALPDDLRSNSQAAAFYYTLSSPQKGFFNGEDARTLISDNNPADKLLRTGGSLFAKLFGSAPKDILCTPSGAKGRVLIDKEPIEFQTTNDGRVIFRMFDEKKTTFQAKSDITRLYEHEAQDIRRALDKYKSEKWDRIRYIARDVCEYPVYAEIGAITKFCQNPQVKALNNKSMRDEDYSLLADLIEKSGMIEALDGQKDGPVLVHGNVQFSECLDPACSTTKMSATPIKSMVPWIGETDPAPVGLALNHVPRDQRELGYVIDYDCPKGTKCQNLVLKNPERMTAKSLAEAHLVIATARSYQKRLAEEHRIATMTLAPLHGCCADVACRANDFGKTLKFVSADDGKASGKPVSR